MFNAKELIKTFGSDLTMTRTSGASYNPATGSVTGGETEVAYIKGVFMDYKQNDLNFSSIETGDRKFIYYPNQDDISADPQIGDVITGSGNEVKVREVRRVATNEGVVAFVCRVAI